MLGLGGLAFAQPLLLAALVALPAIWLLLRVIPPSPRRRPFPPIVLLLGLKEEDRTSARMPWWLLALRLAIAALIIMALAGPVVQPVPAASGNGPIMLVVDDGFAAAPGWTRTRIGVERVLAAARREDRPVLLLRTAGDLAGVRIMPMTAADALVALERRGPAAWPSDRAGALAATAELSERPAAIWWFSDGTTTGPVDRAAAIELARTLQERATTRLVLPDRADMPILLRHGAPDEHALTALVQRPAPGPARDLRLLAVAAKGEVVGSAEITLPADATEVPAAIRLPIDLRNRVERLEIEKRQGAGEVLLIDERWRRRSVGIVATADEGQDQPLLTEAWYLERALRPYADVGRGSVAQLIETHPAAILVPDAATLNDAERQALQRWITDGGVLVRFAGPRLAATPDALVPVPLREGDRQLGGALTWTEPLALAPFPQTGPFAGLAVPEDVRIRRQVLARPGPDLAGTTLATLVDGTPLVTGARRDDGWLVLIHTSADSSWSDLALSGVFVDMLRRLTALGRGDERNARGSLQPLAVLDGAGALVPPQPGIGSLDAATFGTAPVSATRPPGFWASGELQRSDEEAPRRALDIATALPPLGTIDGPALALPEARIGPSSELELGPVLLLAAFVLALVDLVVTMWLRGLVPVARRAAVPAAMLAGLLLAAPVAQAQSDDARAMAATLVTRLAWVETGIPATDRISAAGLHGLSMVLRERTSVDAEEPLMVNVETDDLALYPMLYWPVPPDHPSLSDAAVAKVGLYLRQGGMIVFDTGDAGRTMADDQQGPGAARLAEIFHGLELPPLSPIDPDHALGRSFYLLPEFPGRFAARTVWADRPRGEVNDGVSSIIVGSVDWAGAWATDDSDNYLLPVSPGGEEQREMARRVGVNIVMYALTGNYKTDQVHVPALLERLGQ